MAQPIKHAIIDPAVDEIVRDGDHDAILTKVYVKTANLDTVVPHRMGRVPRQIQIVWKDGLCDFKVSKDSKGQPMQDTEKVVLQFSLANTTLLIRMA